MDQEQLEEYATQAEAAWGNTPAYQEYTRKHAGRSKEENQMLGKQMMDIFRRMGQLKDQSPTSTEALALAKELQDFITAHYYTCTDEILLGLGTMYAAGGDFTDNINAAGGIGTADFANQAIKALVSSKRTA